MFYYKSIKQKNNSYREKLITIQAGCKGLEGAFYEELVQSTIETFGKEFVSISSINRKKSYLNQVLLSADLRKSKYVLLDPRTLNSNLLVGIMQAFFSSFYYSVNSIKPIVFLTDASVVKWRLMSLIWTSTEGICVMLMDPLQLGRLFPHKRVYGPIFIPISVKRRNFSNIQPAPSKLIDKPKFGFQGTIYPERKVFLEKFQSSCDSLGVHFCVQEKNSQSSNEDYWQFIRDHDVVITSTIQTNVENNLVDHLEINQLVFRVSEVIAAGRLLISTPVVGIDKFFLPGIDFIEIKDVEEVFGSCKSAIFDLANRQNSVATHAKNTYEGLIRNKCFWRMLEIVEVGPCTREFCGCVKTLIR